MSVKDGRNLVTGANTGIGFETAAALAGRGFDQRCAQSANANALKQAPRKIMLKQPETYLTFSNIDWTFSKLDLSHYYFLTKSG